MVSEMSSDFKVRLTKVQLNPSFLVETPGITVNKFSRLSFFICKMKLLPIFYRTAGIKQDDKSVRLTRMLSI